MYQPAQTNFLFNFMAPLNLKIIKSKNTSKKKKSLAESWSFFSKEGNVNYLDPQVRH